MLLLTQRYGQPLSSCPNGEGSSYPPSASRHWLLGGLVANRSPSLEGTLLQAQSPLWTGDPGHQAGCHVMQEEGPAAILLCIVEELDGK